MATNTAHGIPERFLVKPEILTAIRERTDELRKAGVRADHRIWPLTPAAAQLFTAGVTVFEIVTTARAHDGKARALTQLCTGMRHGHIVISLHQPA